MTSPKKLARIAGALYLVASVLFILADLVRGRVLVPGDAAATVDQLRSSETMFRLGLAADLLSGVLFLCTAIALYALLKHVSGPIGTLMIALVTFGVGVGVVASVAEYTALSIAGDASYAAAVGRSALEAHVMLLVELQRRALIFDELVSGLWLLPLGYLALRSGYFPRVIGALLMIGGISWLAHLFISAGSTGLHQRGIASRGRHRRRAGVHRVAAGQGRECAARGSIEELRVPRSRPDSNRRSRP